jgi:integrase
MVNGSTKTEASAKDVPLDSELANALMRLLQASPYQEKTDWVFASPKMKGKQPLWPDSLWYRLGKPALKAAGITKRVCYHTFRHTFGTLLNASGENPKVVQELLRHANLKVTTDTYMQALSSDKRRAQAKLVTMVRGRKATA